jgi:hypothetical protein
VGLEEGGLSADVESVREVGGVEVAIEKDLEK